MKCYWTVNSSYWPLLRVSQYEVNTSWPPQQKSIVLQYWKPKINSFSYAEKKIMAYVHQLLDQPSQWQTSQQAGPCSMPKFTNTSITVKYLLIKNKNINQSKSSLLIWHYVSYLFLLKQILVKETNICGSCNIGENICDFRSAWRFYLFLLTFYFGRKVSNIGHRLFINAVTI